MKLVRCECSRCKLYLRAENVQDPGVAAFVAGMEKTKFEHREYQSALIELAKNQNIIACLPTGSGKTFIAYKLIQHFQPDILNQGKKVIFLANTIPLVNQQAAFFARNTDFKVRHITGDMEVDYWSQDKWEKIIDGFQIMAMTSQIFLNLIRHAYITFQQVVLMVFDECHHAVKDHPMNVIMKEYRLTKDKSYGSDYPMPRVLGLTATVIKGTCKPSEVPSKIQELEQIMYSKAVTFKDYEEVMRHSTSAEITKLTVYPSNFNDDWYPDHLVTEMTQLSKSLQEFRKERKKKKLSILRIEGIDPELRNINNVYLIAKKPGAGDLKTALDDVGHIYKDLGPYCAVIAINLRLAFIRFSMMDLNDGEMKRWYEVVERYFLKLKSWCTGLMEYVSDEQKAMDFTSPKLLKLIKSIGEKFRNSESQPICPLEEDDGQRLCGLVFVERRATAQVLSWFLQDLASASEDYKFIKASFVVGTSHSPFETVESRVYAKKQTETINGFRMRKYNLLVATSVLEEGIDVPSCNLVVRFDKISTYTSYVQSMGRARKSGAAFFAFIDGTDEVKQSANLDNYKAVHLALVTYLRSQVEKVDIHYSQNLSNPFEAFEIFQPGGELDSPRITLDSAFEIVDRYCMLLPCDGIVSLQTISWWESRGQEFVANIKLPMNGVLKRKVSGQPMRNKELARHAAFFQAAKQLYELKALDEKFVPIHPEIPDYIEAFFEREVPSEINEDREADSTGKDIGTGLKSIPFEVNREWYKKKLPKLFDPLVEPSRSMCANLGKSFKIYQISLKRSTASENYSWNNLYNDQLQNSAYSFGIITAGPIPEIGSFPIFGGFGTITVELKELDSITLNNDNLYLIYNFQFLLFFTLLGFNNPFLTKGDMKGSHYFICPLEKDPNGVWTISKRILRKKEGEGFPVATEMLKIQQAEPPRRRLVKSAKEYEGAIVVPWYKGEPNPVYLVDTVEIGMNPMSEFHDNSYPHYKDFYEKQYKKKVGTIYNPNQPLLKCKLSGIGKHAPKAAKSLRQMNYLLQKHAKEDDDPVYLVPELCNVYTETSAAFFIQLKFIPSIMHRLVRLLIAREILEDVSNLCDWTGALGSTAKAEVDSKLEDNIDVARFEAAQNERKAKLEERRIQREKIRNRFPRKVEPIPEKVHIENRLLHYEFIHPNKITEKNVQLFHEAVSTQHAAKKLTRATVIENVDNDLSPASRIDLIDPADVQLPLMDLKLNLESDSGPSLLSILEGLTVMNSNDGVSLDRFKEIGRTFISYATSCDTFLRFPTWSEPLMCQLRNRLLSLQFMVSVGKKRDIGQRLSGGVFYPNDTWIPPGIAVRPHLSEIALENKIHFGIFDGLSKLYEKTEEDLKKHVAGRIDMVRKARAEKSTKTRITDTTYTHTELNDVNIAEGIQALVGCFFTHNGPDAAYCLLKWFGFSVPDSQGQSIALGSPFDYNCKYETEGEDYSETLKKVRSLLPNAEQLETFLGYTFKDKRLLLEAFTHPSYPANVLLDCYQRLEFLGDAVLDLLLTTHVYTMLPKHYTLEQLEDIRAALVNNITYSSLSVRYGFHKSLLSMSQSLVDMIDNFVVHQETFNHRVVGHYTLISDEECWGPNHMEVPKVLGDIFEALAGAIYMDSGRSLDTVWKIFYRLMQNEIDEFTEVIPTSPIRELTTKFGDQLKFSSWTSKKTRARGRDMVKISVAHHGHYYGCGTSRARAKQAAAKIALKMIKEEDSFTKSREDLGDTIAMLV